MEATSRLLGIDRLLGYPSATGTSNISEEEEKFEEHFYKTRVSLLLKENGEEIVKGTLLLTPNSIMFDPDLSDPMVIKNGAERYGRMCNVSAVSDITLYCFNETKCTTEQGEKVEAEVEVEVEKDEVSYHFPYISYILKNVKDQLIPNENWDIEDFERFDAKNTAGRLICIELHQAMKRTFSSSESDHEEVEKETKKTWFQVEKESTNDIFSFFVQSTHDEKNQTFISTSEKCKQLSTQQDEISEQFSKLSIDRSSINIEWQVKRKPSSSSATSLTSSINAPSSMDDVTESNEKIPDDIDLLLDDELPELLGRSNLLTEEHIKKINDRLPASAVGYPWKLSYSTFEHGMSLKTLYRKVEMYKDEQRPCVFVVQDDQSHIFGCYCSCHPHRSEHFAGTGESFLFKLSPSSQSGFYSWTGDNSFFMKGDHDSLAFGSGDGRIGLWLDENLLNGSSQPSKTFDNPTLSSTTDFTIDGVEVWTLEF